MPKGDGRNLISFYFEKGNMKKTEETEVTIINLPKSELIPTYHTKAIALDLKFFGGEI